MILQDVSQGGQPAAHRVTHDRVLDLTALKVWQTTPVEVRRSNPTAVWDRCLSIARTLRGAAQ